MVTGIDHAYAIGTDATGTFGTNSCLGLVAGGLTNGLPVAVGAVPSTGLPVHEWVRRGRLA